MTKHLLYLIVFFRLKSNYQPDNLEIFVVDGDSTDHTIEIVKTNGRINFYNNSCL